MSKTKNAASATRSPTTLKRAHGVQGGTCEANRLAVVILEVLAGGRTPQEAATALGVALPRYYQLEIRALQGLVAAMEPRPKVRQPSPEGRIAQLEKALLESRRETARQRALVRAAERSLGIKTSLASEGKPMTKDKAGRRRRRPTVRALKAVKALANASAPVDDNSLQSTEPSDRFAESAPQGDDAPPSGLPTLSQGTGG
jgi:hypothetical protein